MNALSIAQAVQKLGAILLVEHGQVVIRSQGPLPEELQQEVRAHKAELLIALGVPLDQTVATILGDLRPYLPQSLQRLAERGLLRSQESVRHRHTVRRTIEGARSHRPPSGCQPPPWRIGPIVPFVPLQYGRRRGWVDSEGRFSHRAAGIDPQNRPTERPALPQDAAAGSIGPIGTVPEPTNEVELRI